MSRFAVLALLCLALGASFIGASASPASAARPQYNYIWPASEKWAFIDHWSNWATLRGYEYPNLYADCLQKSASVFWPSYASMMRAGANYRAWLNSPSMTHCIVAYGQKWYDD
jgi:hypothetical protein